MQKDALLPWIDGASGFGAVSDVEREFNERRRESLPLFGNAFRECCFGAVAEKLQANRALTLRKE